MRECRHSSIHRLVHVQLGHVEHLLTYRGNTHYLVNVLSTKHIYSTHCDFNFLDTLILGADIGRSLGGWRGTIPGMTLMSGAITTFWACLSRKSIIQKRI